MQSHVSLVIRDLDGIDEIHHVEHLQREIWSMSDNLEVVPSHLLITAQKNGGLLLGAFDGDQMAGFLFGFPGLDAAGKLKHCSHMLGVIKSYRGQGVGHLLKQRQRERVRAQGIDMITWTYDPLERANATLNIHKLRATTRSYLRNVYGDMRDDLNRGLPSDRFMVEWPTDPQVDQHHHPLRTFDQLALSGVCFVLQTDVIAPGIRHPGTLRPAQGEWLAIEFPHDFQRLKATDREVAARWRSVTGEAFERCFALGYRVVDAVSLTHDGEPRSFYLLRPESATRVGSITGDPDGITH
jgi:predicted GNAT superfamily acetyltransferase